MMVQSSRPTNGISSWTQSAMSNARRSSGNSSSTSEPIVVLAAPVLLMVQVLRNCLEACASASIADHSAAEEDQAERAADHEHEKRRDLADPLFADRDREPE